MWYALLNHSENHVFTIDSLFYAKVNSMNLLYCMKSQALKFCCNFKYQITTVRKKTESETFKYLRDASCFLTWILISCILLGICSHNCYFPLIAGVHTNPASDEKFKEVMDEQFETMKKQKDIYLAEERALRVRNFVQYFQLNTNSEIKICCVFGHILCSLILLYDCYIALLIFLR